MAASLLVLVTTQAGTTLSNDTKYVYVDWGPEFLFQHAAAFPEEAPQPLLRSQAACA